MRSLFGCPRQAAPATHSLGPYSAQGRLWVPNTFVTEHDDRDGQLAVLMARQSEQPEDLDERQVAEDTPWPSFVARQRRRKSS